MNTYIDLGCYDGDTVEEFRNWRKLAFPQKKEWKVYAFDPNPKFKQKWETMKDSNITFSNKAAWIEDTTLEFAVDSSDTPLGSTIMKSKKKIWDSSIKINVEAFDFSDWLKQFRSDYVVVKFDCEGAEFPILDKMVKDGTITIPNKLLVEFHPNKVTEFTTNDKTRMIDLIKSLGVDILEWH